METFLADSHVDYLLKHLNNHDLADSLVNEALLGIFFPDNEQLFSNCLYLLDCVMNGAKDWSGDKIFFATEDGFSDMSSNLQYVSRQTLGRGVTWLSHHHIAVKDTLVKVMSLFRESFVPLSSLPISVRDEVVQMSNTLGSRITYSDNPRVSLKWLAETMFDYWDSLWDFDLSYDLIASVVYLEDTMEELDPLEVISLVKNMESEFISESIQ